MAARKRARQPDQLERASCTRPPRASPAITTSCAATTGASSPASPPGITRPGPFNAIPNLGPGYGFHYSPHQPRAPRLNFDTPEYANIVSPALAHYDAARHARAWRPCRTRVCGPCARWITRLLAGSWTHAGYLNWDTGYGSAAGTRAQYWAFAQQGLLAIASAGASGRARSTGRWTKAIFDHGLELYERWGREGGGVLAPQHMFDVRSRHRDVDLYAARIAANAARAIVLGLGSRRAEDPPPLYAFDVETGRLAVTTPRYSTAIVPDNRGAFPYGGIDLARLFGPGQRIAANIGGEPPSTFGAIVRDAAGRELLASQHGRGRLRLTRSPHGPVSRGQDPYAARPHAGTFHTLESRGSIAAAGVRITTDHTFAPRHIDARWHIHCRGCAGRVVDLLLPTWGPAAHVDAIRPDGTAIRLAGDGKDRATLPLRAIARLDLGRGVRGGYTVLPLSRTRHGVLHTIQPRWQNTNPHPGPTLAIRLVAHRRFRHTSFALRLVPHGGPDSRGAT